MQSERGGVGGRGTEKGGKREGVKTRMRGALA